MSATELPEPGSRACDRIVEMAWEDRTPFEAIEFQFGLSEPQVIELMRREMKPSSFRMWRKRVQGRNSKHRQKRSYSRSRGTLSARAFGHTGFTGTSLWVETWRRAPG